MKPGLGERKAREVEGGKDRRGLWQPGAFQVLGGDSEDAAELFEVMNIIKEATIERLVGFFNAMRPQGIH